MALGDQAASAASSIKLTSVAQQTRALHKMIFGPGEPRLTGATGHYRQSELAPFVRSSAFRRSVGWLLPRGRVNVELRTVVVPGCAPIKVGSGVTLEFINHSGQRLPHVFGDSSFDPLQPVSGSGPARFAGFFARAPGEPQISLRQHHANAEMARPS